MRSLPLAVKIAEIAREAAGHGWRIDVPATADRLLNDHPEAQASHSQVVNVLREQIAASMPGRRKLKAEDKQKISEDIAAKERFLHPDERVRVHVEDETDDQGKPVVKTVRILEMEIGGSVRKEEWAHSLLGAWNH